MQPSDQMSLGRPTLAAGAPRLPELVKMLAWAQAKLGERGVRFPRMQDPATAALVGP